MANWSSVTSSNPFWTRYLSGITVLVIGLGGMIALFGSFVIGTTNYGLYVIVGLLAAIVGITIMLRPQIGMYILVIFVFMNFSDVLEVSFGIPDTNKLLVALIFVGTLANRIVLNQKPLIFRGTEMIIMAYGVVVIISLIGAQGQSDVVSIVIDWVKDFLIIFIIVQLGGESRVWKRMQWMLIIAAGILAALSTYQTISGNYQNTFWGLAKAPVHQVIGEYDDNRITGPLDDPNFYAMMLTMALPIAAYRMLTERKTRRMIFAGVLFVLITATILFTYSRGAFVSMIIVGILIIRERKYNPYKMGAILLALVLMISPFLPTGFWERMNTITDIMPSSGVERQTEASFRGRSSEAIVALQMFKDYPLLGVGRGNYALNYLKYSSRLGIDDRLENRQAHSLYLELAAEMGIIGIFVFTLMLWVLFQGLVNAKRLLREANRPDLIPWVTGLQLSLVGYLLPSIFLHADYMRYFWLICAFAASASVMAEEQNRRAAERKLSTLSTNRQPNL